MAQRLFTETAVNDVTEMKDLVDGYENQNKFLNGEVLALHRIIHTLEENERMLTLKNFNAEALYYQLKSRHLMVCLLHGTNIHN
jgi:hypothetical protein